MKKKTPLIIGGAALAALLVFGGAGVALGSSDVFDGDDDGVTNSQSTSNRDDNDRDRDDDSDDRSDDVVVTPSATPTASPTATAYAAPTAAETDSASQAALAAAGGDGTVTEVERSDDADHAWEVEVTFADGRDVDVELDADFGLVRIDD